jgi:hypothetical protein
MPRTLLALYAKAQDARDAVQDLVDLGCPREGISMATPQGEKTAGEVQAGLMADLTGLGIAVVDAEPFAEGVARGNSLVVATVEGEQLDSAAAALERYEPMELRAGIRRGVRVIRHVELHREQDEHIIRHLDQLHCADTDPATEQGELAAKD